MAETETALADEMADDIAGLKPMDKRLSKLGSLKAPSFEGYFASGSKSFAFNKGGEKLNSTIENKFREIENHLEHIICLLREIDKLRMVVRVEGRSQQKKRFMTIVENDLNHSIILGIDWHTAGPTIGLVLPISNSTETKFEDGGLHISKSLTQQHMFKPVSVQTLWSAKQIIDKAIDYATKNNYFEGTETNGFVEYYRDLISSDTRSIVEWSEMGDAGTNISYDMINNPDEDPEVESMKDVIRNILREVMRNVNLDEVSCYEVFQLCQENLGMDLKIHKKFINEEMLVVMGQMDSASKILDYLYLGSEWNASSLHDLKELGIGYILNITKEVDNFFPKTFNYYNIRIYDEENTELLKHWDHTYRFIERAHQAGSKVLVHCRYGISRSASTVIAYVMKKKGWGMIESLMYVKGIRNVVEPNQGFQKQLIIYEGILNSSRNRFSKLFDVPLSEENGLKKPGKRKQLSALHDLHKKNSDLNVTEDIIEKENEHPVGLSENVIDDSSNSGELYSENIDLTNQNVIDIENGKHSEEVDTDSDALSKDDNEVTSATEEEILAHDSLITSRRLRRAKTMTSGAVLLEEEGEIEQVKSVCLDRTPSVEMRDADEDDLMQQVVKAREMKHQLIGSINKLPTVPAHNDGLTNIIKPSGLKKLSHSKTLDI